MTKRKEDSYFYHRFKADFFTLSKITSLECEPQGTEMLMIFLKLRALATYHEGCVLVSDNIYYTPISLSFQIHTNVALLQKALFRLKEYKLIDFFLVNQKDESRWEYSQVKIYILDNFQYLIGQSSTSAERQLKYDRKIANEKKNELKKLRANKE